VSASWTNTEVHGNNLIPKSWQALLVIILEHNPVGISKVHIDGPCQSECTRKWRAHVRTHGG
jgi:hypothetical protein